MIVYHATLASNLPRIRREGLVPRKQKPGECEKKIDSWLRELKVDPKRVPRWVVEVPIDRCRESPDMIYVAMNPEWARDNSLASTEAKGILELNVGLWKDGRHDFRGSHREDQLESGYEWALETATEMAIEHSTRSHGEGSAVLLTLDVPEDWLEIPKGELASRIVRHSIPPERILQAVTINGDEHALADVLVNAAGKRGIEFHRRMRKQYYEPGGIRCVDCSRETLEKAAQMQNASRWPQTQIEMLGPA